MPKQNLPRSNNPTDPKDIKNGRSQNRKNVLYTYIANLKKQEHKS